MRWVAAGIAGVWLLITVAHFVSDHGSPVAPVAFSAFVGWGVAAIAEWQLASAKETIRRLARLVRGRA